MVFNGIIEVGADGQPIDPIVVLSSRGGNKIGVVSNVQSIERTHPLNDVAELSFDVYKEIDGKICDNWDDLKDFKFIHIPYDDTWFEAHVSIDEENDTIKHVSCIHANEAELSQLNLYDTEINTEGDIDRDSYETTVFYDEDNPNASLLHRILKDKAPHYQIYHVDESLRNIFRTFSFNGVSIHDALNQIAKEVNCLFVYGEWSENDGQYHRTISAYDLEDYCVDCGKRGEYTNGICTNCNSDNIVYGYGDDTGIFVSVENLTDSINYSSNTDNVKNCFRLVAGDDVMTAAVKSVNPSMSQYIWYFTDDMLEDMSDELRSAITGYMSLVDEYRDERELDLPQSVITKYNSIVDKYLQYNEDLKKIDAPVVGTAELTDVYYNAITLYGFLKSELMPVSESVTTTTADEQMSILRTGDNMSEVGISDVSGTIPYTTANSAIQSYAKVYIDTSRYKVSAFTQSINEALWNGTITITSYTDDEDSATGTFTIQLFDGTNVEKYTTWVEQKVQKAMANREATDLSVVNLFKSNERLEDFKNRIKLYSLDNLNIMADMATSAITIMTEQGIANPNTTASDVYTQLYEPYYNKSIAIQDEILSREEELSVILQPTDENGNPLPLYPDKGILDIIADIQDAIRVELNIQNYLTDQQWTELSYYRREDQYQNSNYISDGLNDSEIIERAQQFLDVANKEIVKAATLQHTISASLKNLLLIPEFFNLQHKFKTGNWIRLKVDEKVYRLRMTNWTIDYNEIEDLDVEFSDVVRSGNIISDVESILSKSRSIATTYDYTARQADKGDDAANTVKIYRDYGIDFSQVKAIVSRGNTNIVYDDDGILLQKIDDNETLPEQARIYNNGIYITKDAWRTVSTGLGHFSYKDPETGETVDTYGIVADTVIGKLILGENLKIYSDSGKLEMGDDGLKVTSIDGEDNTDLFVVQKQKVDEQGRPYVEKYIYVDSDGNVQIRGNSIMIGSQPLIEYIEDTVDGSIGDAMPVIVEIESSAGNIFKNRGINTILTCNVRQGNTDVSDRVVSYHWIKYDMNGNVDHGWSRESVKSITLSAADIQSKGVFKCEVTLN